MFSILCACLSACLLKKGPPYDHHLDLFKPVHFLTSPYPFPLSQDQLESELLAFDWRAFLLLIFFVSLISTTYFVYKYWVIVVRVYVYRYWVIVVRVYVYRYWVIVDRVCVYRYWVIVDHVYVYRYWVIVDHVYVYRYWVIVDRVYVYRYSWVRRSSKDAMALSMRVGGASSIEHYLIQTDPRGLKLEGSVLSFSTLPLLINHYYHNAWVSALSLSLQWWILLRSSSLVK